jgi:Protein of unknown function (DUF664)
MQDKMPEMAGFDDAWAIVTQPKDREPVADELEPLIRRVSADVLTTPANLRKEAAMPAHEQNHLAKQYFSNRRSFLHGSAVLTAGLSTLFGALSLPHTVHANDSTLNILGPRPGYSPQLGTFVSLLTWMRDANGVISATKNLTTADLDYLIDPNANTIGALMLHLAANETYYQLNTFEGKKWDTWADSVKKQWDPAMNLGDAGRKTIKGHDRDYYLNILQETRAKTLAEFSKRDDVWLMAVDKDWFWGPTNNYCKWFHVCEHEAHHTGQIAFLRKRLPGAKPDSD